MCKTYKLQRQSMLGKHFHFTLAMKLKNAITSRHEDIISVRD